ncbi:MAG: CCA tRNA nucleotidyltransferase [Armatimonadetes bacterium]|nr:CCA tRNA nucleotidyltransferase [Armatimonadota bacterium]
MGERRGGRHWDAAHAVVRRLREAGHAGYWVGGCVRDLIMGREPADIDIATDARPEHLLVLFPRAVVVGAQFGVVRVPVEDGLLDVATFRTEGPYLDGRHPSYVWYADAEADVRRRDFTINGLLYDPVEDRVLDFVVGREDIARRVIRTIGAPQERFEEDRLRMLRAVRLAAELGFTIEASTWRAIRAAAHRIAEISAERIRDEIVRLLTGPDPSRGLDVLHWSRLLAVVLPEVEAMVGVPQPPEFHPEGDVFTHTRLALRHLEQPPAVLAMGTLLHDAGKPLTMQADEERIRFPRHDEVGALLAEAACRRLRFSGDQTERVVALVREHMRFADLPKMRPGKAARFLARPDFPDHLAFHRADVLASHGNLSTYHWARQAWERLPDEMRRPPRWVTGDDLIGLGLPPGPRFRELLAEVEDAQYEGRVRSREEALALVQAILGREKNASGGA